MIEIKNTLLLSIGLETHYHTALLPCMLERTVERHLVQKARDAGGLAIKWVAPSMSGVPDRIVFFPGGRIVFVELKAPGQKQTPIQVRVMEMLLALGAEVRVIDSKEAVDALFA